MANSKDIPLEEQLQALDQDDEWTVLETFKKTETERTQKVARRVDGDEVSVPFIRKEFSPDSKQGEAYNFLWQEQWKGRFLSHCPKIEDYYEYAGTRVVILGFSPGVTLEEYIRENSLSNEQIRSIFADICEAVRELHETFETPLIHRDLKPTNIIINSDKVSIIDFGIARVRRGGLTPDTTQFGTPAFAPPEQYGFSETSVESDIYALGMVLYFMLTKKLSKMPLRDNPTFSQEIPSQFKDILLKATAFDPQDRYHSARELKEAVLSSSEYSDENVQTAVQNSASNNKPIEDKASFSSIKEKVGKVYNAVLFALAALIVFIVFGATFFPNEQGLEYTFPERLVGYVGRVGIPALMWIFVLLDKSRLKERFEWMQKLNWKKYILIVLLSIVIMFGFALLTTAL